MRTTCLLLFAALFLPRGSAAQNWGDLEHETMINERFSVGAGDMLEVDVGDADVEVVTGTSNEVHVEVVLAARDLSDDAREYFERQNLTVTQSGSTVRVQTAEQRRFNFNWRDWRNHPSIYVLVTAPETFDADLRTSDGDINVERLAGNVRLRTSDGDVIVGGLRGANLTLITSDGDIRVDDLEGQTVDIQTSDGDLDFGTTIADRITARTSDGDIRARSLSGDADVRTSDGDIDIASASGPAFYARTADGDITIDKLAAASSTVRTSDGDITVRGIEGDLNVSGSSAYIRLELTRPGEVTATSSDGDISISLPASHGADLRLRGDNVRIARDLDFEGRIEEEDASGALNGGGPLIEARTSDGDVTVRGR